MINTTLCYIRQGGQCLMLHRVKKENDLNQGKWIGIGGKFEDGESPEDCMFREVNEETWTHPSGIPLSGAGHFCLRPLAHGVHASVHHRPLYRNPEGRLPRRATWSGCPGHSCAPSPTGRGTRSF